MLYAHYSNRAESLADVLAAVLRSQSGVPSVFKPDLVVVNNAGMARWLQLQVARINGIAAHIETRFPAEVVWQLLEATIPHVPDSNPFAPHRLAWNLFGILDSVLDDPRFPALANYLGKADDHRQWSLANRLAQLFDQYLVYRPDWIGRWEAGDGQHWQAELWRELVARHENRHWATLRSEFLAAMAHDEVDVETLPSCINVFGVPSLSPGYLELVGAISRHIDVHLYWFNPCRVFWADIFTAREAGDRVDGGRHINIGNDLLANWGKQGRETLDLIQALDPQDYEYYRAPERNSLLTGIQQDILDLVNRGDATIGWPRDDDDSIMIHSCHSPMREIEILHDQLLAYFSRHDDVQPSDVLVMTPDIERYAPLIDAVFRAAPTALRIPFGIADQTIATHAPLLTTFLNLFDLPRSRLTTEYVFALLEDRCVADRFELTTADISLIREWVADAGVRWGFDEAERVATHMPDTNEHTWRLALDRLLLGYVMPVPLAFGDTLPYADIGLSGARALGRFHTFMTRLAGFSSRLAQPMPLADWNALVGQMLDDLFLVPAAQASAMQCVRDAMMEFADSGRKVVDDRPLSAEIVHQYLQEAVQTPSGSTTFLGSGVTFCAMVPMRSVPFALICLVGMDDGAFPRATPVPTLDLMSGDYRRGDRSRRDDDRYLFLETVLCARRGLYLSYVGRDVRDNSERPPSVVVSELLDYAGKGLVDWGTQREQRRLTLMQRLVTCHPLQAFSARYFDGNPRLPGYQRDLARAAAAIEVEPLAPVDFFPIPVLIDESAMKEVSIEQLLRFFANPVRDLMRTRLGVWLDRRDESLDGREPFTLDFDSRELLRQIWLARYAMDGDVDGCERELRQRSLLPHGTPGQLMLEREIREVEAWRPSIQELLDSPCLEPAEIDLHIGGTRITGRLHRIRAGGLLHVHLRKLQARDRIGMAIEHLVGTAAGVLPGLPSQVVGMDARFCYDVRQAPAQCLLESWIDAWREGQSKPLHFFPKSAFAYLDAADPDKAMVRARAAWSGNLYSKGEGDNAYYRKAFADGDPLDEEFVSHVQSLLLPFREFSVKP